MGRQKRRRRAFTPEFKAEAVKVVRQSGRSVAEMARELGLTQTALRRWVDEAEAAAQPGALKLEERAELAELRREVVRLRMERDILKKAAAFFAKEQG